MMTTRKASGFTLIELSIVLVIIGLIVGGVLGGRELIEAAKIRKQISQFEQIAAATAVFKNKYNYLPGDNFFNKDGVINDQNGDQMDVGAGIYEQMNEPTVFFSELVNDKLIEAKFVCAPSNYFGVPLGNYASAINETASLLAVSHNGVTWLFMGLSFSQSTCNNNNIVGSTFANVLTPFQAQTLDQKFDDGVPGTGKFYVTKSVNFHLNGAVDNTAASCVIDSTATQYNVTNDTKLCKVLVKNF